MPLKRFEALKRSLHVVDNTTYDAEKDDKLFKIRPLIEAVRNGCIKVDPEEYQSLDEQIIPSKTRRSKIRQYNPKKPKKWGFKNMVRAGPQDICTIFMCMLEKMNQIMSFRIYKSVHRSFPSFAKHYHQTLDITYSSITGSPLWI